ncbi:MAG: hypothetical protein GX237_11340 [Clostridiales bacterium]|nr:hypothetical protein [Clostridiales bacterium]
MESFFVSVLSSKMSIIYNDTREIVGNDERFNLNWYEVLKKDFYLNMMDDYILVNNLIEFHYEKTQQGGTYISLVGCLSCFEKASYEMNKIIEKISSVILDIPNIFVFGNIYPYDSKSFIPVLKSDYGEKKKAFDSMYREKITICPSRFYEMYKRNSSIISKIKRCFIKGS